jgi:hypothetical protein
MATVLIRVPQLNPTLQLVYIVYYYLLQSIGKNRFRLLYSIYYLLFAIY